LDVSLGDIFVIYFRLRMHKKLFVLLPVVALVAYIFRPCHYPICQLDARYLCTPLCRRLYKDGHPEV